MKPTTKILLITVAVLVAIVWVLWQRNDYLSGEKDRLSANQTVLLDSCKTYRTNLGHYAANVEVLTLKVGELKGRNTYLQQTANELKIKVKRVQSHSITSTNTSVNITAPVKDTTMAINNKQEQFKCFEYKDNWINISGCVGAKFTGTFCSRDTIRQIVHRVPKKFLFFKWGTRAIRQEVISNNPYTKITFTEYIELK